MDEIEMRRAYNECVSLATDIADVKAQRMLHIMLQIIWQLHEDIQEMQLEDDDE